MTMNFSKTMQKSEKALNKEFFLSKTPFRIFPSIFLGLLLFAFEYIPHIKDRLPH